MSLGTLPDTWDDLLSSSKANSNKLLVIKCGASWCAPCKEVMPFVNYLADNYPTIELFDLNIEDETRESLTMKLPIAKVPTFIFIKNGVILENIIYSPSSRENDKGKIENCIVDNL